MAPASGRRLKEPAGWALPASQARSRATRERLLAAAEAVFARRGYQGARLADIAQEAGCSVGAVYFRFKDKDALFFAIAEQFASEARTRMGNAVPQFGTDPDAIVHSFVAAAAENFRNHKGLFRAIVGRGLEHPLAMQVMLSFRDELAASLEQALRKTGMRSRNLPMQVRVMTQLVYGFLLNGVLNRRAPTRIDDTDAVQEVAKAMAAYLRA